jgi:hypothetical protein
LIEHFDIVCQQEMNWNYNATPKLINRLRVEEIPENDIFWSVTLYSKNVCSQCKVLALIEQVMDKATYLCLRWNDFTVYVFIYLFVNLVLSGI